MVEGGGNGLRCLMRSPLLLECAYLWAENAEIMGLSQIVNQQCVTVQDLGLG